VVYIFSGSGRDENTYVPLGTYGVVQAAILATTIKPMIVVNINGGSSGDHRDAQPGSPDYGTFAPQSMFIYEGIPYIDANYNTAATKASRALQGFSMGAQACMRFATKFPQMFSSAYCIAPASDDVAPNYPICSSSGPCSDVTSSEPAQLAALFNNNTAEWQDDSVWGSGAWNAPNVNGLPIHVVAGSVDALEPVAVDYFTLLDDVGVAHDPLTVATGCGHDYTCDTTFVGVNVPWQFASTNFP
jgi:S-formylglutathione hydrolase FrmB